MKIALLAFVMITLAGHAEAEELSKCHQIFYSLHPGPFKLVRLRDKAPEIFDGDRWRPSCPWDIAKCSSDRFTFTPGRLALAGYFHKGLACIVEIDPEGHEGRDGWVEVSHLKMEPQPAGPSFPDWIGAWAHYEDDIVISRAGKRLKVKGTAIWRGAYNTHDGQVEGTSVPRANHLLVEYPNYPDNCRLSLSLVGKYLVAADNENCGGLNVRFNGIYFRKPAIHGPAR